MKKGQGAQFNWIFILVAGIIVLGFFAVFIFKYIELQNKKASFELVRTFNTQLDLLETTNLYGSFAMGVYTKMDFICNGDDFLAVVNNQQDLAYDLGDKVVFAPNSMRDKNFGAWIYEWNYPFLVSRFLYITSSKYRYFLVGNVPNEIDKIPEGVFNIEVTGSLSDNQITDPANTKVVFFSEPNDAERLLSRYKGLEVIYINTITKKVKFYNSNREFDYLGDAFLYGAIFAGNSENYECAMQNAIKKLNLVSRVYSGKIYLIGLNSGAECRNILGILDGILGLFKTYQMGDESLDAYIEKIKEQNFELHGLGCNALF